METKVIDGQEFVAETIPGKGLCFVPKVKDLWDEFLEMYRNYGLNKACNTFKVFTSNVEYKFSEDNKNLISIFRSWSFNSGYIAINHAGMIEKPMLFADLIKTIRAHDWGRSNVYIEKRF